MRKRTTRSPSAKRRAIMPAPFLAACAAASLANKPICARNHRDTFCLRTPSPATIVSVLTRIFRSRIPLTLLLATAAYWAAACTAAFGPGYDIVKQELSVQFRPAPEPVIRIDATYQLKNTGNQPLTFIELRLPGRRRFHFADPRAEWDKTALTFEPSPDNPRNVQLKFPQPWKASSLHTLHLAVEYQRTAADEAVLSFTPDAFFLPAQGWSPELLPARGIFATGGVPPAKWNLVVKIPDGFLVHTSGHIKRQSKTSRVGGAQVVRALQDSKD